MHVIASLSDKMTPEVAMERYRAAWLDWKDETNDGVRHRLEHVMDSLQSHISPGPGPVWDKFKATLPGYNEYWAGAREFVEKKLKELLGD